jgi:hypothetical protein
LRVGPESDRLKELAGPLAGVAGEFVHLLSLLLGEFQLFPNNGC